MKVKIKLLEIDEGVEDVEFFLNFKFQGSERVYQAEFFDADSKFLHSLLGKDITADLYFQARRHSVNEQKKLALLSTLDLKTTNILTCGYTCWGKVLSIDRENWAMTFLSERFMDVKWTGRDRQIGFCKFADLKEDEFYTLEGSLSIEEIDEVEEYYEKVIKQRELDKKNKA